MSLDDGLRRVQSGDFDAARVGATTAEVQQEALQRGPRTCCSCSATRLSEATPDTILQRTPVGSAGEESDRVVYC